MEWKLNFKSTVLYNMQCCVGLLLAGIQKCEVRNWLMVIGVRIGDTEVFVLIPCTVHLLLFFTMNNKMRNYFTNYHTATCFDTIVSSSCSLYSIPCQVTQVFQMQLLVIQFTIKMFHIDFMQVLILYSLKYQYYKIFKNIKIALFTTKWAKIILLLQFS